jgi:hypothetical protein
LEREGITSLQSCNGARRHHRGKLAFVNYQFSGYLVRVTHGIAREEVAIAVEPGSGLGAPSSTTNYQNCIANINGQVSAPAPNGCAVVR